MDYRRLWENKFGKIPIDKTGRTYEIHHIDGNNKNNEIDNLQCVTINEHYDVHFKQSDYQACMIISTRMDETPAELKLKLTGRKRSDESRLKMSNSHMGIKLSESHKTAIGNGLMGHVVSDKTRQKLSESLNGHVVSTETKLKMSKYRRGIPSWNRRPVIQFDIHDNVVCEWKSICEATTTLKINNINKVLKGTRKTAGGFIWKYKF